MRRSLRYFVTHDVVAALLGAVVAAAIWEMITLITTISWLPSPSAVAARMPKLFEDTAFRSAFLSSLGTTIFGFAIATVVGGLCGIAMAVSRIAELGLRYYIDALLLIPPVALAPVLIVVFGITSTNVLIITVLFALGVIAVNSAASVRGVDKIWMEVGQVFGANKVNLIRVVVIPGILPQFFSGLHLGITRAFKGMIIGQVFLGVIGVGAYLAKFQQAFDTSGIWAIAILLIAVSLILTWCVQAVDHVINYWAYRD